MIGESDPEGCAACQGPQLGYRNGTMYSSYTAASFARKYDLAERHGVNLEGALTWAFEFEDQPYFAGFRVLATNGIDLPVLNVFRMFSLMGGRRVAGAELGGSRISTAILATRRARHPRRLRAGRRSTGTRSPSWSGTITTTTSRGRTPRSRSTSRAARGRWPGPVAPLPGGSASQQRVRGMEADGLAPASDGRTVRRAGPGVPAGAAGFPGMAAGRGGEIKLRMTLPRQAVSLLRLERRTAPVAMPKGQ